MTMFWREKHTKIFLMELSGIACVGMVAALLMIRAQESRIKGLFLAHDTAITASLLEMGLEEQTVAETMAKVYTDEGETLKTARTAVAQGEDGPSEAARQGDRAAAGAMPGKSAEAWEAGRILLGRIGLSEDTDIRLIPCLHGFCAGGRRAVIATLALFLAAFAFCVFRYLGRQDRIYREAIAAIENCGEDDFFLRLPERCDGTLYQLFSRINFMAGMLQTRQEAENRAKEFLKRAVADISHQLKTPLAALSLYQEIIQNEPEASQTVALFAEKSGRTLCRMEGLVKTLLKLARLDAGSVVFHKRMIAVGELALEAAGEFTDRAKKEGKEFHLSGTQDAQIFCDPNWTREALANLIKNALDHTGERDRICIAWEQTPLMTRVTVADTGEGIAPEDIHHIFKRFYKSEENKDGQAVGLGLSLVKSIAESQGGTVCAQSEVGQGTTFFLALPNTEPGF